MWTHWLKPICLGILGVCVGLAAWHGYTIYQQHTALWAWAQQAEGRIQRLTPPTPSPIVPSLTPKEKGK